MSHSTLPLILLVPVALTSLVAYLIGPVRAGSRRAPVGIAIRRALECVGLAAVFCVLNVLVGAGVVLAIRTLTGRFIGLYVMSDVVLLPLSLLQALVFWWWRVLSSPADR